MSRAFGNAGGLETSINSIDTIITFYRFASIRIELGNFPWTGARTSHAANAFFLVNIDDAVSSFDHGRGGTSRHTKGIVAVITGTEGKLCPGDAAYGFQGRVTYYTGNRADRQEFAGLAVDLAGVTADTAPGVVIEVIFVHSSTSLLGLLVLRRTVTNTSQRLIAPPAWSQSSSLPVMSFWSLIPAW